MPFSVADMELKNAPEIAEGLYEYMKAAILGYTIGMEPFYSAIEKRRRQVVRNPLINRDGHYEIDFDDLEEKARDPRNTLPLLCSPHNPVGRGWTKEELLAVLDRNRKLLTSFLEARMPRVKVINMEGFERMNLACPTWVMEAALKRVEEAMRKY